MHVAVGLGDADYNAHSWVPMHDAFYEKVGGKDKVTRVGTLVEGAVQGYLIDKKTADQYGIKTINDLTDPDLAKIFDANGDGKADLTGCNPGWGCERVIEHHMDAYDLKKTVTHNQGSYFALIADTISRYKSGEPILYYTWSPQWVSGVLVPGEDVTWLAVTHTDLPEEEKGANTVTPDGKNLGFSVNSIHVLANNKFLEANPAARRFFELAQIPINDIGAQNLKMRDGEKKSRIFTGMRMNGSPGTRRHLITGFRKPAARLNNTGQQNQRWLGNVSYERKRNHLRTTAGTGDSSH